MHRLALDPYSRTHRVRPSEKPPFAPSPGLRPEGLLPIAWPSRGGAGSARPLRKASAWPRHVPGRPQASGLIIGWKRHASAFVGPRKADAQSAPLRENRLSRHFRALPRKASLAGMAHMAEGRAPHARIGRHRLDRGMCPVGQPASCLIIGWRRHASAFVGPRKADAQSASLRENRLSRHLQVCARKAFSPSLGHLAEGRAPHARLAGFASTRGSPH
jgi:hypothetical protein